MTDAPLTPQEVVREPISTADGIDITEAVQILYDIAHSSMDWGSGFLDNDEMEQVIRLAVLMGWEVPDLPDRDSAICSVALKFPEHYRIEYRTWPATQYTAERRIEYIKKIDQSERTSRTGE